MNRFSRSVLLLLYSIGPVIAFGQNAQAQFQYGPRIGLGFSSFSGRDAHNTNFPAGTIVGIYTNTTLTNTLSLNVELNYISCGSVFTLKYNTPEEYKVKTALGYLSLPVNADIKLYKNIHIEAGVQVAYLLSAITQEELNDTIIKQTNRSGYHSIDWGPTVGCYYQFKQGLQLGIRYYSGMQSVYTEKAIVRNTYVQFLITYAFSKLPE